MKFFPTYVVVILFVFLSSCKEAEAELDLDAPPRVGVVSALIEIPAGTNKKIEFNKSSKKFEMDVLDGKERVIRFLPYPANYGFIPFTLMDKSRGGDSDPLDVLVIAESLATGTFIDIQPIAALLLEDSGELDTKIIAIPVDSSLRVIDATDFQSFTVRYNAAQRIIQDWFLNYKGVGKTKLLAWKNERFARAEIEKWRVKDN